MKVVKRKISELKPSEYNPRRLTKEQEKHLTASLSEFGLVDPIVVNINPERKDIIIGGHQRLKVWRKLGNKEIDCVELDLSAEKERELNIRLNANTGEWDEELLQEFFQIEELQDWGLDFEWKVDEDEAEEDDFNEAPHENPKTVLGDLYEIGEHRLLCGDSTDVNDVIKLMDGRKADMVFTDPPYDIEDNIQYQKSIDASCENGHIFVMHDDIGIVSYLRNSTFLFKRFFVADFKFASPRGNDPYLRHILISHEEKGDAIKHQNHHDGLSSIIKMDYRKNIKDDKTTHGHQKSILFISNFIKHYSQVDFLILDLFLGSGSTMVAAHQLKRKCYGMELDPKYCDVIVRRMLNYDSTFKIKRNGIDCTEEFL